MESARAIGVLTGAILAWVGWMAETADARASTLRAHGTAAPWPVEARLFGPDLATAFSEQVAQDGDTALVAASGADIEGNPLQGAVYVFVKEDGVWAQQALLLAPDGAEEDRFGSSVAIDGDTAVIGAELADVDGAGDQGAAYTFERSGSQWVPAQKLIASDGKALDKFGSSVAIAGDTIAVGAVTADIAGAEGQGAAYVFTKLGAAWAEEAKLFDAEGQASDLFGNDLALLGGILIVGAFSANIEGDPSRGAAYVYTGTEASWALQQKLFASDGENTDEFGYSVALDAETALIGAWQKDIDGKVAQGAAYLFRRDGTIWTEVQRLTASDGQEDGFFGIEVALLDGVALVGAMFDFPGDKLRGVVYEFRPQGGTWSEIQKFAAPEGNGIDSFGAGIALAADRALISHPGEAVLPPAGGSAWIFGRPIVFEDGFESGDTTAWSQTVQ